MAGQYHDKETNLFYNYYRFYDPKTGRYVTSDPIGLQGGLNTYGYVNASPLKYIDQFGLDASLYPKDPSMADPSDYVIEKDESNGYGQSCSNSCQKIKMFHYVSTVQEAERMNRNSQHFGTAYGVFLGLIMNRCGISTYQSMAIGTGLAVAMTEKSTHIESGDTIVAEYTVCCGGNDLGTNNIKPKVEIIRR